MIYQPSCYNSSKRLREKKYVDRTAAKVKKILEMIDPDGSDKRCLEIGCAYGAMSNTLKDIFPLVISLEYDQVAINHIPVELKRDIYFIKGDGLFLPIKDNSVDVIVCTQVYEHVPDSRQLFEEMYRVLMPGGYAFFSGPNAVFPIEPHYFLPFLHWLPQKAADMYLRLTGKGEHFYEKIYSYKKLQKMLKKFSITDVTYNVFLDEIQKGVPFLFPVFNRMPSFGKKMIVNILPNLNWVLYK